MSQLPTRSLRLRSYATVDLDRLTGEKGEIFYDYQQKTLKVYNGAGQAASTVNVGETNRLTNGEYQITLGSDGIITIQGEIQSTTSVGIAAIDVDPNAGPNGSGSGLYAEIFTLVYAYEDVILRANNNGVYKDWTFSTSGTLTAPGAITAAGIVTNSITTEDSSALDIGSEGIRINVNSDIVISGDITPTVDNVYSLGSDILRWRSLHIGPGTLFIQDQNNAGLNAQLTVRDGVLQINGANQLQVGVLKFVNNAIATTDPSLDIFLGTEVDTGFAYVKRKLHIDNDTFSSTEAMVDINASGGEEPATLFPDTLLQTTSRPNKSSRIVQRAYGSTGVVGGDNSYAVWASYAARGTVSAPVALKQNDILARISANGYGASTWGSGGARVEFVALENFTDAAKGSKINFWTVPTGQVASQNVASVTATGLSAAAVTFTADNTTQTTAGIPLTQKGAALGVATLDSGGRLTTAQIPTALTGAIVFKGVWNASTNTPTLSSSLPVGLQTGWEYVVEVGGTRNIGDGSKTFNAGDFVIYDGSQWKQVASGDAFVSLTGGGGITVSSSTGAITLGSTATALSTNSAIVARDASGNFAANVITANLTGTVTGSVTGNAGTVTNGVYTTSVAAVTNTMLVNSTVTVNGTSIALGASATVTAAAGTLTGTTLNSSVVTSSLTALGGMSTIKAGEVSINPANIGKQTTATQTVTVTGLTTSHKVVVTAGAALPEGLFVAAAWVSAADTLSVNFHNWSGGVDAAAFNLRYFAWV